MHPEISYVHIQVSHGAGVMPAGAEAKPAEMTAAPFDACVA